MTGQRQDDDPHGTEPAADEARPGPPREEGAADVGTAPAAQPRNGETTA